MSHVPCHQQPQTIPLLNPPTLSATFWRVFLKSLLDVNFGHPFKTSLFDVTFRHPFTTSLWTSLLNVTFGRHFGEDCVYVETSRGPIPWWVGWHSRQTDTQTPFGQNWPMAKSEKICMYLLLPPLLEITRHEPEQSYTRSRRLWQECRLS